MRFLLALSVLFGFGHQLLAEACNPEHRPLLFVHGFLASGDSFSHQAIRFQADGYCPDRIWVFDWNTINRNPAALDSLDHYIDFILAETGFDQLDLAGHSAGGGLGYQFLAEADRAAKIAHYIHIGSGKQTSPAGPDGSKVPTLNIWSPDDKVVPGGDIPGAENARLDGADHYEVATSLPSYRAMYAFLNDTPAPEEVLEFRPLITVKGRVLSLGENIPEDGAVITAFEVDENGNANPSANLEISTDQEGYFEAEISSENHLFKVVPRQGRTVFYFVEGMIAPSDLLYFRTLPKPGTMASLLFAALPKEGEQTAAILFGANRAFTHGRDVLELDGSLLSTEELTNVDETSIALVLYDDGDQQTTLSSIGPFANFPFLVGVDWFRNAADGPLNLRLNDRVIKVPAIPASEGVLVIVLDL